MEQEHYEDPEITRERAQRVYEYAKRTIAEHKRTCSLCSYWLLRDEEIRCSEYHDRQLTRDKWH